MSARIKSNHIRESQCKCENNIDEILPRASTQLPDRQTEHPSSIFMLTCSCELWLLQRHHLLLLLLLLLADTDLLADSGHCSLVPRKQTRRGGEGGRKGDRGRGGGS
jgi:hypothetical protein